MRLRRAEQSVCAVLAVCFAVARARAEDTIQPVILEWTAPETCPSRESVLVEISRLLGGLPRSSSVRASVIIRSEGDSNWHARIAFGGAASGERELDGHSCAALARATALIIGLTVDPEAVALTTPRQEASRPPVAPRETARKPAPAAHRALAARSRPRVQAWFTGSVFVEHAFAPSAALGPALSGGVQRAGLAAEVLAAYLPRTSATLRSNAGAGADFRFAVLDVRGCAISPAPVAASGCVALRGVRTWVRGRGVAETFDESVTTLAVAPGVGLAWTPVRDIWPAPLIAVAADVVVPWSRPRFVIENLAGTIHEVPALGWSARFGFGLMF